MESNYVSRQTALRGITGQRVTTAQQLAQALEAEKAERIGGGWLRLIGRVGRMLYNEHPKAVVEQQRFDREWSAYEADVEATVVLRARDGRDWPWPRAPKPIQIVEAIR